MSHSSPVRKLRALDANSAFETYDPEFEAVLGGSPRLIEAVATGAHEGVVYSSSEDALYFTSLPNPQDVPLPGTPAVDIKRLALDGDRFPVGPERISIVRSRANAANGMALDRDGNLVVCEQGTRGEHARISRLAPDSGDVHTIVDNWCGLRFNSPNDIVVKSDGTLWFTDPAYGYLQGFKGEPQIGDYVYRYDPGSDRLSVVADSFDKPNGLAFSPGEDVLYITDSGANQEAGSFYPGRPHHIMAFDVRDERHLVNARLFAVTAPGFPDGIKVDRKGRVYTSSSTGVQVFNPIGDLIGELHLPGAVNFAFGGWSSRNILYISTDIAIWAAVLSAKGV
jgi:gluconolactonase